MDRVKIKNLIIIILVLVCFFFLLIIISNSRREQDAAQLRTEALTVILQKQGITLAEDVELPESCGRVVELERSLRAEKRMLSGLIGSNSCSDQGGDIYVFDGESGDASISGGGEIKLAVNAPGSFGGESRVADAKTVLKKLGIEYDGQSITESIEDGLDCVTATCLYKGTPVLNANISVFFSEGHFVYLTGRRLPDGVTGTETANEKLDAVTVIMAFLENIRQTGGVCNEIRRVSTAYILDSASVGSNKLTPVWCIETDTGIYYFDGVTGRPRTPEA